MSDRAERCDRCRFWNPLRDDPDPSDLWECRRMPPVLPTAQYLATELPDEDPGDGVWPLTAGPDWCGCFEPLVPAPLGGLTEAQVRDLIANSDRPLDPPDDRSRPS